MPHHNIIPVQVHITPPLAGGANIGVASTPATLLQLGCNLSVEITTDRR